MNCSSFAHAGEPAHIQMASEWNVTDIYLISEFRLTLLDEIPPSLLYPFIYRPYDYFPLGSCPMIIAINAKMAAIHVAMLPFPFVSIGLLFL